MSYMASSSSIPHHILFFVENSSANAYLKIQPSVCRVHAIGGDGHVPCLHLPSSPVFYLAMARKLSRLTVSAWLVLVVLD